MKGRNAMSNGSQIFAPCTDGMRLGLGGAPLGNLFRPVTDETAGSLLQAALADGCRCFDTAPHYGHGLSEHRMGSALRKAPAEMTLSTKVGRILTANREAARTQNGYLDILPFNQHWDYSAEGIRRSVEDSLQRLGRAALGAVFIHDCDRANHGEAYPKVLEQVIGEAIPELLRLKNEGLITAIGLGVNDVQVCLDVLACVELDCLLLAGRYTLLDQEALGSLMPLCAESGIRVAIGGVFNSGILATGVKQSVGAPIFNYAAAPAHWIEKARQLEALCDAYSVPLRAAALQFPLAHPAVEIVVIGAHELQHWIDAREMMRFSIPLGFWRELRSRGLVAENAPLPEGA